MKYVAVGVVAGTLLGGLLVRRVDAGRRELHRRCDMTEEPVWDIVTRGWSCPPGYMHPKCEGCGHNFFECKPVKIEPEVHASQTGRKYPTAGFCRWCMDEREDGSDDEEEDDLACFL